VRRTYRKARETAGRLRAKGRTVDLRIRYPGLSVDSATKIGKGCSVICADDSQIVLQNVVVQDGAVLRAHGGGHIEITDAHVGYYSLIAARGSIKIASGCQIAEMVVIRDHDHAFGSGQQLASSEFTTLPVEIRENVWIGAKATILKGVTIGKDSVVAASAVVTHDISDGWLHAGVPARAVRQLTAPRPVEGS
jgi:acetyltransferase-like isoleucine patch superfamily enzyme